MLIRGKEINISLISRADLEFHLQGTLQSLDGCQKQIEEMKIFRTRRINKIEELLSEQTNRSIILDSFEAWFQDYFVGDPEDDGEGEGMFLSLMEGFRNGKT